MVYKGVSSYYGPKFHGKLTANGEIFDMYGVNFKDNQQNALKFLNDLGNPYDYVTKDISGKNSIYFIIIFGCRIRFYVIC